MLQISIYLRSLDANSSTRLHQKQISPSSRTGLQQSLREAILGGSGGSSNGDGSNCQRDMIRIGSFKRTFKFNYLLDSAKIYEV